jgi:hypothetical protein
LSFFIEKSFIFVQSLLYLSGNGLIPHSIFKLSFEKPTEDIKMTGLELIQLLQNDVDVQEAVTVLLRDRFLELLETDMELRAAAVAVIQEDMSFDLDCSSQYDYYSSGYCISLSVNGQTVSSTSFSVD